MRDTITIIRGIPSNTAIYMCVLSVKGPPRIEIVTLPGTGSYTRDKPLWT